MKPLYPSFAPPESWRTKKEKQKSRTEEWRSLRGKILLRDDHTCAYCGYKAEKYQIVDHIDGNPNNNDSANLQVICQMCNLIKHSGFGCEVLDVVDLYEDSGYSQNETIIMTRNLRDEGKTDKEIIEQIGLKRPASFKMDRDHLKRLTGFVTSRAPKEYDNMYAGWISYHKEKAWEARKNMRRDNGRETRRLDPQPKGITF